MSRGLEAVYKLLNLENGKAIFAYSGDDFSFRMIKKLPALMMVELKFYYQHLRMMK
ncbi:hypothetical protein [Desulfosporosinus sp. Sb-LF]|uniref:hypothetical protein n=1 Tax=Desulfosporosinus sp. Sb-LF TaxID=2560027 RepID=UPI001305416C|nr:hypothetical protein [Desulfosporosinus sp. Sb-LF]